MSFENDVMGTIERMGAERMNARGDLPRDICDLLTEGEMHLRTLLGMLHAERAARKLSGEVTP